MPNQTKNLPEVFSPWLMPSSKRYFVLAAALVYLMSIGYGTLEVYAHNQSNFPSYNPFLVLTIVGVGLLLVSFLSSIVSVLLPISWRQLASLGLLGYALLSWLERLLSTPGTSKDMLLAYGEITYKGVAISMLTAFAMLEILRRIRRVHLEKLVMRVTLFLCVVNALSLIWTARQVEWDMEFTPVIDESTQFNISKTKNVFVFILDTFQSGPFAQLLDRNKTLHEGFKDFTFYPDVVGCHPGTYPSIPCFLTGKPYTVEQDYRDYLNEVYTQKSLLHVLKDRGYINHVYQPQEGIVYDPTLIDSLKPAPTRKDIARELLINVAAGFYRSSPVFVKGIYRPEKLVDRIRLHYNVIPLLNNYGFEPDEIEGSNDLRFTLQFSNNVNPTFEEPVFTMYHLKGVHLPLNLGSGFEIMEMKATRENYLIVAENKLHLVQMMLERLRELDLYDSSTIVIAGDHGAYFDIGRYTNDILVPPPNMRESVDEASGFPSDSTAGLPLLLVKAPGSVHERLEVDTTALSMIDFSEILLKNMEPNPDLSSLEKNERYFYFTLFDSLMPETKVSTLDKYEIIGRAWWPTAWKKDNSL